MKTVQMDIVHEDAITYAILYFVANTRNMRISENTDIIVTEIDDCNPNFTSVTSTASMAIDSK